MSIEESKAKRQRIKLIGAVALLVIAVLLILRYTLGSTSPERFSAERVFKCVDCGHDFEHVIQLGDTEPLPCPKCGKMTAWKAEACYWTKDAAGNWKAKLNPTYVVLKSRVDPNTTEKTYCPDKDCGHVVVGHNPKPSRDLMEAAQKEAGK